MSQYMTLCFSRNLSLRPNLITFRALCTPISREPPENVGGEEEFRVLNITGKKPRLQKREQKFGKPAPPRSSQMPVDQDWGSVWPGPRVFHPAVVPLPLRQGKVKRGQAPPHKWANAELMKVPNFLHLTPPVIKRQCAAIKRFCSEWPKGLDTDEKCDQHYPIETITTDYCHSGPTIRNPLSRIVAIRIKLSTLKLDKIATDKFRRLVGERYDEDTDVVTVTVDRCPMKNQNIDYAMYLLTACFYESWKREPWEDEKTEEDMEEYIWDNNASKQSAIRYYLGCNGNFEPTEDDIKNVDLSTIPYIEQYKKSVSDYFNNGESEEEIMKYRNSVLDLLGLPPMRDDTQRQISAS